MAVSPVFIRYATGTFGWGDGEGKGEPANQLPSVIWILMYLEILANWKLSAADRRAVG